MGSASASGKRVAFGDFPHPFSSNDLGFVWSHSVHPYLTAGEGRHREGKGLHAPQPSWLSAAPSHAGPCPGMHLRIPCRASEGTPTPSLITQMLSLTGSNRPSAHLGAGFLNNKRPHLLSAYRVPGTVKTIRGSACLPSQSSLGKSWAETEPWNTGARALPHMLGTPTGPTADPDAKSMRSTWQRAGPLETPGFQAKPRQLPSLISYF